MQLLGDLEYLLNLYEYIFVYERILYTAITKFIHERC